MARSGGRRTPGERAYGYRSKVPSWAPPHDQTGQGPIGDTQARLDGGRFKTHEFGRLIDLQAEPAAEQDTVGAGRRQAVVQGRHTRVARRGLFDAQLDLVSKFLPDVSRGLG